MWGHAEKMQCIRAFSPEVSWFFDLWVSSSRNCQIQIFSFLVGYPVCDILLEQPEQTNRGRFVRVRVGSEKTLLCATALEVLVIIINRIGEILSIKNCDVTTSLIYVAEKRRLSYIREEQHRIVRCVLFLLVFLLFYCCSGAILLLWLLPEHM